MEHPKKKLKIELPYDPATPPQGIYLTRKDLCTCMFTAVLFTISKMWKQPKCPDHRARDPVGWGPLP